MTNENMPKYAQLFIPIFTVLEELGGSGSKEEINDLVIEKYGNQIDFLAKELNDQENDRIQYVKNIISWARNYLVIADILQSSDKNIYSFTEKGQKIDIDAAEALKLFKEAREIINRNKRKSMKSKEIVEEITDEVESPEQVLEAEYKSQLLDILKSLPPAGFEKICQRILREAGFEKVTVTGKSGDGGIDGIGILQVNPFVSFNVLFQCKRYQGSVSSSQVRDFRGAMMGRADKGIFLTTGSFTIDAKNEARREGVPQIELIDGEKLIEIFEKHKIGLKSKNTYEIDLTFFDKFR